MKIHYFFYLLFLWIGRVALAQTTTENYVLSHTYRTATTTELSGNVFVGTSLTPATALVQTVISYLDGLGKPKLEVAVYNSPNQTTHNSGPFNKDIVVKTTYDAQQRPQYNYLPVTPAFGEGSYAFYTESNTYINRSDGAYRADVNMSYYNSSNNVCNTTTAAYIETRYETSPLSRVSEQLAPGVSTGVRTEFQVSNLSNAEPIKLYKDTPMSNTLDYGYYPDNSLNVVESQDEDNKKIREYRDRYNRLVLKRVVLETNIFLDTYYVYDQRGQLQYVLQPQYQVDDNLNKYAFHYSYDNQGRMTEKKRVPGMTSITSVIVMAYNNDNDLLTQLTDAKGQIFKYEYDALNRLNKTRFGDNDVSYTYYDNYEDFTPLQTFTNEFSLGADDFVVNSQMSNRKGLVTGASTRVLNDNGTLGDWLKSVVYYDNKYRVIQTIRQLYGLGSEAYERISYKYDFKGNVLIERTTQSISNVTYILEKTYTYDHADRLQSIAHKLYQGSTLKKEYTHLTNTYNEIGQLSQKTLHGGAQTLTYKYTPRGWLCNIDKSAGQTFKVGLAYNPNGNINTLSWETPNSGNSNSFNSISYDGANRLTSANGSPYQENISYDKNGNILTLQRTKNISSIVTTIDNLTYNAMNYPYDGNRLMQVSDASNNTDGFKDNGNSGNDYAYDANGNLTQDLNRLILANGIVYNPLNLTQQVTINSQTVKYTYDAAGNKRQMQAAISTGSITTNYEGIFEYTTKIENSTTTSTVRIGLEEGQLIRDGNNYTVNYYLKDHLGNVRTVINETGTTALQETDYYPFGLPVVRNGSANNNYLYNGKEKQPETQWLDFGARMYMSDIGRWGGVDAFIEKNNMVSGYNYGSNNPLLFTDFFGMDTLRANDNSTNIKRGDVILFDNGTNFTASTDEVVIKREKDETTPWQVGWEWLSGTGARERTFRNGDYFTELLKKHDHIDNTRIMIANNFLHRNGRGAWQGQNPYRLGGVQGIPKYFNDYSTLLTGGLTGNLAVTYLGSFNLTYKVTSVDMANQVVTVEFNVFNSSTINSATHPPLIGYTQWWNNNIGSRLNEQFSTGPMSRTVQEFTWKEKIKY